LLIKEKREYFKKAQNWNEVIFTALFVGTSILDVIRLFNLIKYPLDNQEQTLRAYRDAEYQNWFRIMYALLVISGAWRMLNYA
jgi:hypothetical protein